MKLAETYKIIVANAKENTEKNLGMWWRIYEDLFTFLRRKNTKLNEEILTAKREVLQAVIPIFD